MKEAWRRPRARTVPEPFPKLAVTPVAASSGGTW